MIFEYLTVGPLQCNCFILGCPDTKEAVVIDPGDEAERVLRVLEKNRLSLKGILHTHAHIDHVGGSHPLKKETGARVSQSKEDLFLIENLSLQADFLGLPVPSSVRVDQFLGDKEEISFGSFSAKSLHTPGHTPGSLCFYLSADREILFSGDTLFAGSIGRTDLWGGSYGDILHSLEMLMGLPGKTQVFPGHGPPTTIEKEKASNPFCQELF